jgi:hypothetical protein
VVRCSLEERFMWSDSLPRLLRQVMVDVFPVGLPLREVARIYLMRGWLVVRGSLTWTAGNA